MTKIINGGDIGLADRKKRYEDAIAILGGKVKLAPVAAKTEDSGVYKLGSKGDVVKEIQKLLKLTADGDFGRGTQGAVKTFQRNYGLNDDGVVGPKTLAKMREKLK